MSFNIISISEQDKKLNKVIEVIDKKAKELGLEHNDTIFEIVSQDRMRELSSYVLPIRYHHWTFGRDYYKHRTMDKYGRGGRLYEMVINSQPAYAWLLDSNSLMENKLVVAHVFGHVDFSENNMLFNTTDRRIVSSAAKNAEIVSGYAFKYGEEEVERWIDACLSLSWNIELNTTKVESRKWITKKDSLNVNDINSDLNKMFENFDELDPVFLAEKLKELLVYKQKLEEPEPMMEKDLLLYFIYNAKNLSKWQKDVMSIIREEQRYFRPNIQTKNINEGWSCITKDSLISTNKGFIPIKELFEIKNDILIRNLNKLTSISDFYTSNQGKIIKLTLRNGLIIRGLEDHKVQIWNGVNQETKLLKDITTDHKVITGLNQNIWSNKDSNVDFNIKFDKNVGESKLMHLNMPDRINKDISRLLGYIVAEGCFAKREIRIVNKDINLLIDGYNICKINFNYEPVLKARKAFNEIGEYDLKIYSSYVRRFFELCGLKNVKSIDKEIPSLILQSTKETICSFLSGLFEGDGCISVKSRQLIFISKSQKLVFQVAMLMNNLGINTSYGKNKKKGHKDCHRLTISTKKNLEKFRDEIGFISDNKIGKLNNAISSYMWSKSRNEQIELDGNDEWQATDVFSIEEDGFEECYDITIPEGHVYVANGILNHNSWWHRKILMDLDVECDFLREDDEDMHLKFAAMHSNVVSPTSLGSFHPYFVGFKMWDHIFQKLQNPDENFKKNHGIEKPLTEKEAIEQMKIYREFNSDISFFRNFLDDELVEELDLFNFRLIHDEWLVTSNKPKDVIENLCHIKSNAEIPQIFIVNDNHNDDGELYLIQDYDGRLIEEETIKKVMEYIGKIWIKPIHLECVQRYNDELVIDLKTNKKSLIEGDEYIKVYTYTGKDKLDTKTIPFFPRSISERAKLEATSTLRKIKENRKRMENQINSIN